MRKYVLIIMILSTQFFGCKNNNKQILKNQSASEPIMNKFDSSTHYKNKKLIAGLYYLNVHIKDNAGWLHFNAFDGTSSNYIDPVPSFNTGYYPVNELSYNIILPSGDIAEIIPTMTVFRLSDGRPSRGGWHISFDISCIGDDLVERKVTPLYIINARNYYDELKKDNIPDPNYANKTDDGFKIYLKKKFTLSDIPIMLKTNTDRYTAFNISTGRQ